MKETKFINCEQYVLSRLCDLEAENKALKDKVARRESEIADHEATIGYLAERYDILVSTIQERMSVKFTHDGNDRFISVDAPWERFDSDFSEWVELFGLVLPEVENKEEN